GALRERARPARAGGRPAGGRGARPGARRARRERAAPERDALPPARLRGGRAQAVRTVLFVGAGRHQRRAILRAKELGLRVAAVDRESDAPGLAEADIAKVVDIADVAALLKATARLRIDGVLTVAADRAVPVVAAIAEAR